MLLKREMTYELAKKLKEDGFPVEWYIDNSGYELPTLSRLITACGDHLESVTNDPRGWIAREPLKVNISDKFRGLTAGGSTPEEAVANLWLELNKHANNKTEKSI